MEGSNQAKNITSQHKERALKKALSILGKNICLVKKASSKILIAQVRKVANAAPITPKSGIKNKFAQRFMIKLTKFTSK